MLQKIKQNKVELLKALHEFVKESLSFAEINGMIDSEVSEMIADMQNKRRIKKLKIINKELDRWLKALKTDPADFKLFPDGY